MLTINALTAADEVLVPLQCETLSHRGVGQLLDTVAEVRRLTNPRLRVLGVLPTLYEARSRHSRSVLADVSTRYGIAVLEPPIVRSVRFAEAPACGRSVLATARRSRGATAYRRHARQLVEAHRGPRRRPRPAADLDIDVSNDLDGGAAPTAGSTRPSKVTA